MSLQDFDARAVQPQQGGLNNHPLGMFDFVISHTYLKVTKDTEGLRLIVELTTPAGKIDNGYNIFNKSPQAVEISQKQLSALCHAVSVYKLSYPRNPDGSPVMDQAARELRNARGRVEIVPQKKKNETGEWVETGFPEVGTIFDMQGNAPGKGAATQPAQQAQPQQNAAPMQQQPGGGWNNAPQQQPPQQPQQPQQQQPQQWGAPQGQPQNPAPQQAGGWQPQQPQGGNPPAAPWNK